MLNSVEHENSFITSGPNFGSIRPVLVDFFGHIVAEKNVKGIYKRVEVYNMVYE